MSTLPVKIEISTDVICNALQSAVDSGIGYWARSVEVTTDPDPDQVNAAPRWAGAFVRAAVFGGEVTILEKHGDGPSKPLNAETLAQGLADMARHYPRHFAALLADMSDAETGDVLVQLCTFGDVLYG